MSKGYQTRVRNSKYRCQKSEISGQMWPDVKKVRTPRLQGLDPGEIDSRDFPFRVLKSRK